jgi:hypothetical protein
MQPQPWLRNELLLQQPSLRKTMVTVTREDGHYLILILCRLQGQIERCYQRT